MSFRTVMKPHMKNSAVTMVRARAFVEGWSVTAGVSDMEVIPFSRRAGVSFTISQAQKRISFHHYTSRHSALFIMWHSKFHSVVDFLLDKIFAGARKDQHSISAVAARYSVGPSQYDKLLSAFFLGGQNDGQRTGRNSYLHQGSHIGLRKLGAPRHATPCISYLIRM